MYSACLCSKKSSQFTPYITYKNEVVFKNFEGIIIGACKKCGLLKTLLPENREFNPRQSRQDMYESRKSFFVNLFTPIVEKIERYKPSGKILDVGCSSGILLELLKKQNFDIYGIEPNKDAFGIAKRKFGNKIFHGTLTQFYYSVLIRSSKQKFDIVIYNHVLEHVIDHRKEITIAKKILKKDGILVIGAPNTNNIIFKIRKKYWESLMPLEHVWHFSEQYLTAFLYNLGFEILDSSFSDDTRQDYPIMKRVYFKLLSLINTLFHTGEAMLLVTKKQS